MEHQPPPPKLFPHIQACIHAKQLSQRTAFTYVNWIKRFILHHGKRHPREMGVVEVEAFLNHLVTSLGVAASTQNQAKTALIFLYHEVLNQPLPALHALVTAKATQPLPVVLTPQEMQALLGRLTGTPWLIASLLYGSGLRVMECLRLRVNDIDLRKRQLLVRNAQGYKDRINLLPASLVHPLTQQLEKVAAIHEEDLALGFGEVALDIAIEKKYPGSGRDWIWQYVFPAQKRSLDSNNQIRRQHADEKTVQRAIKQAAATANIQKVVTPQTLRHSFAAHLLQGGQDPHQVQKLMGHQDINTTMRYTQVIMDGHLGISSPLDVL